MNINDFNDTIGDLTDDFDGLVFLCGTSSLGSSISNIKTHLSYIAITIFPAY